MHDIIFTLPDYHNIKNNNRYIAIQNCKYKLILYILIFIGIKFNHVKTSKLFTKLFRIII